MQRINDKGSQNRYKADIYCKGYYDVLSNYNNQGFSGV